MDDSDQITNIEKFNGSNIIDDFLLNEIVLNYCNIENYALLCPEWITLIGPNLSRFCDVIGRDYIVGI